MAEELTRTLESRAERGTPRGAHIVLDEARRQAVGDGKRRRSFRSGPVIAFAAAVAVLFIAGGVLLATRLLVPDESPVVTVPPAPTITPTTTAAAPDQIAPPVEPVDVGATDRVWDLAIAPDGSLWAATEAGVVRWDLETNSPTVFSETDGLGGRAVYWLDITADGAVWAAGANWLAYYDGAWTVVGEDVLPDLPDRIGDLAVGPDGALWVAAGTDALIRLDDSGVTRSLTPGSLPTSEPWTFSIDIDTGGTVWASVVIGGPAGLETRILAFDGEWREYGVDDGLPGKLMGNIAVAADGSVWVGGDGLYGDPEGDIPAAGIARFDGSNWVTFTTADGLLSDDGEVVVGPDGAVWAIHRSLPEQLADKLDVRLPSGLSRFDGTGWQTYPDIPTAGRAAAVAADGTIWMAADEGILGFDGNATTELVVGLEGVPPLSTEVVRLEPAEGLAPVRLSTAIGEIEFTTWALPENWDGLWWMTATDEGIVARLIPGESNMISSDGVTWAATEAEPFRFKRADGPIGSVKVHGDEVSYWDGTEFVEASQPPDRTLYASDSAGCLPPGWSGESPSPSMGPVVATDAGFIILAARAEADWYKDPVCEPLMWFSPDGDVWVPTSDESPLGEGAFVHDIASVGNTIVAIGGLGWDAAVWMTTDGFDWQRGEIDAGELWFLAGSERGWIAAGHGQMWFSVDGLAWDGPYERPPGWGDRAGLFASVAMLDDLIIASGKQFDSPGMAMDAALPRVVVGEFLDD